MPNLKKAVTTEKSERLKLAESISNFSKQQKQFLEAHSELKDYQVNIFNDLDLQIESKKKELEDLTSQYEHREANLQIGCDINVRKHARAEALRILADSDEIAISSEEYKVVMTK